ncbi:D-sedoheptulose 7-phosphate isomerase [Fulvivirga sediminis]|uniref:Phosphoheptose isomerase n=1 Tax=Fulvivirga sediminis TaxID=2803949 RepID=A0A937F9I2_9BACT|nr:D-sedoheptulose 7-phosphate isomerase [Fulvivirga sediminis]MBL3656764.1 D-sedoheptulose 7-phosphate isomerase [Fulvivirga sediminis]
MSNLQLIKQELLQASDVLDDFLTDTTNIQKIESAANLFVESFKKGGKAISCGNGGSHCDAMHFAEELTGRFRDERKPLPAVAISDSSHITCVGNDYGYDKVFSRFVEALGTENDVLLAISTSGNSRNIIEAARVARANGVKVVALTGNGGGELGEMADLEIRVPHYGYADRIQEVHIKVIHILIMLIEKMV